jgi:hypothetical protein
MRATHRRKCCPFAHPGEHARRRPLDKFIYSAQMCSYARREAECPQGDACPFSHHPFEVRKTEDPSRAFCAAPLQTNLHA